MTAQAPNPHAPAAASSSLRADIRAEMAPMFAELRAFMDRRIAELSAEVSATSDMADMAEENISRKLGQVHEQIAKLVAIPAASTRNSGLELEAVVQATETAANTIMEATEAIQAWINSGQKDQASIEALSARVNSIFEACSFQDVTGQRIRRAIQHLQQVETMLEHIVPGAAGNGPMAQVRVLTQMRTVSEEAQRAPDLSQADIDALLNGQSGGAGMSQADIDALLNG
ncbi:protein phosphatase CheZ [Teichococcus oryzae]|uniref:Protein phosphatase CheZ n=1 Tax=Teichococcus oryzae TaxID=1608942 RepID=A0A5B2TD18_9PROT|nr:protein phosphatase CheZ [Pseudoroseomonas oryzae]KAA2211965.1 protein phosphatase CheZ [Pseudoroseomonas oryzae]